MSCEVQIHQGENREIMSVKSGENLLKLLQKSGFSISASCGGKGLCGKCKVKITAGDSTITSQEQKLLSREELNQGIRLACLVDIEADLTVELPTEQKAEIVTEGLERKVNLAPRMKKFCISPAEPTIEDQRDYLTRIYDQLPVQKANYSVLEKLEEIKEAKTVTTAVKGKKLVQLEEGNQVESNYGIAVDIGTTTVVLYLLNLETGDEVDVYSFTNPQSQFGADVISRVNYTLEQAGGEEKLQEVLIAELNQGIDKLVSRNELTHDQIWAVNIVGNTIMLHTLLGLNAESIAKAPYIPAFTDQVTLNPADLDLKLNSAGEINLLPSISGYVGADIVGDMLAVDFNLSEDWNLLIDIGTNGELVLGKEDEIFACAAAAGPALEGANITFGMAGVPGAISEYEIKVNGEINYQVIGNQSPQGICGSGVLDIIAQLYTQGFLTKNGAFKEELPARQRMRMTSYEDAPAYQVTGKSSGNILLTQQDIREVQLAKGAVAAGIEILLSEAGIDYEAVDNVYLAGGFGSQIKASSAAVLGLIPPELEEKVVKIGNGAGIGAKLSLLNQELSRAAEEITNQVDYIELSTHSDFQTIFMQEMEF